MLRWVHCGFSCTGLESVSIFFAGLYLFSIAARCGSFLKWLTAPLVMDREQALITCSLSSDFLRRSVLELRRRFFHFVKSWNKRMSQGHWCFRGYNYFLNGIFNMLKLRHIVVTYKVQSPPLALISSGATNSQPTQGPVAALELLMASHYPEDTPPPPHPPPFLWIADI